MSFSLLEIVEFLSKALFFLGYFSSFKKLSPPLEPQEEKRILTLMAQGDKDARDTLIKHNLRLVVHIAKKYQSTPIDMEDLISIGIIGLIKASGSYDLKKNTKFATFASKCIDNEILMALRCNLRSATNIYLDDIVSRGEDGSKLSLMDMLSKENDGKDEFYEFENRYAAQSVLSLIDTHLNDIEVKVIRMRYAVNAPETMTQAQIARQLGISRSYVSRIEKRAIAKLSKSALK